jgi:energy-coupling factor transporter ATP-binding protein EcfA2
VVAARNAPGPTDHLTALAAALEAVDLRSPEIDCRSLETRDRLVRSIRSYLVPRIGGQTGPLAVVFAGPTGSGKSTLVNSLSGHLVSKTGPLRPTTKGPIVLAREADVSTFREIGGVACEVVGGRAPILERMVLVDTPDIDSTATDHRAMAETLIDNADLVVFVTSALRYADLVPWEVLRRAVSRGTPVIQVLNRVTADSGAALSDFKRRLNDEGLDDEVMRVPEHHVGAASHAVPALAVAGLRRRLFALAEDRDHYQQEVADRVLKTTLDQTRALVAEIDSAAAVREIEEARIEELYSGPPDLTGLAVPLGLKPPAGPGLFRRWLWLRRNRSEAADLALFTQEASRAVRARVETDIGVRATSLPLLANIAPDLARETAPVIESAVGGWVGLVEERVGDLPERDRNLATKTLISAVLGSTDARDTLSMVWPGGDLIERAALDLTSRLEVPYTHAARVGAERVASLHGAPITADVVGRLADAVVASQLTDA